MHIKRIKGREYYYESKRVGKKVTSVYIGPVSKCGAHGTAAKFEEDEESAEQPEEFYVG